MIFVSVILLNDFSKSSFADAFKIGFMIGFVTFDKIFLKVFLTEVFDASSLFLASKGLFFDFISDSLFFPVPKCSLKKLLIFPNFEFLSAIYTHLLVKYM